MSRSDTKSKVVRVDGFPWTTKKQEILHFFAGINIPNGANGIHFVVVNNRLDHSSNDAYIEVASEEDLRKIKQYDKRPFGNNIVKGRSIEGYYCKFILNEAFGRKTKKSIHFDIPSRA